MVYYELKKALGYWGSKIALILLAGIVVLNCWTATNSHGTGWVNEQGLEETGPSAVEKLRSAKREWSGYLDTEHLTAVLQENQRINATAEYQSRDYTLNDIAFGWKQGISDIRDVINNFFSEDFNTFDYRIVDSIRADVLPEIYNNRIILLKTWLCEKDSNAYNLYSEAEKQWLVAQYENLETPMYYTYHEGWEQVCENSQMVIMICSMVLGYLVCGIFANEFKWKADSIYFSSPLGRTTCTKAKIRSGFLLVTVVYWACMLLYSLYTLCYLGFDGWNCPVQLERWKCFYNVTFLERYLLAILGGYLGNLFSAFLVMWVSAKTKSAIIPVTLPFLLIFLPTFLQNYEGTLIGKILGLMPDRLMQINYAMNYFDVYSLGGFVVGAIPILFILYLILTTIFIPAMYQEFKKKELT